jgi:hypothetical protein
MYHAKNLEDGTSIGNSHITFTYTPILWLTKPGQPYTKCTMPKNLDMAQALAQLLDCYSG